jgi:dihydroorotase/N-acyl-D-amino-acid deacylase
MKRTAVKLKKACLLIAVIVFAAGNAWAQAAPPSSSSLAERIQKIMDRPEFRHAMFGIEFYSLDTGQPIYRLNADKFFTPASTTKLLTEGTILELLGADYRFHTRIYRTGTVSADGVLHGDLVLVASGDPNLSGRIQADGTLAFENEDHSYAGSPDTRAVPGDPLKVIRELAKHVAAKGIKQIDGRVLVDATLFPEGQRELGTRVVISPICVNDNIVDVTLGPGAKPGDAATMRVSPETAYVQFVNRAKTGEGNTGPEIRFTNDIAGPDGTHTVTITGSMPAGKPSILFAYSVPSPTRFAEVVLSEALVAEGVALKISSNAPRPDFFSMAASYMPQNQVAEHISPPLSEAVKVTLKVSQNLHASMAPYILGAVLAKKREDIDQAGFNLEQQFLVKAGLDVSGASQADGAGGATGAFYTPDFMVHYLAFMAKQQDFQVFFNGLPILGRDGTLWNIQTQSSAAGHVHAKTGTFGAYDALNRRRIVTGKGLAGYMTTLDGRHLAFAIYANRVPVPIDDPESTTKIVGQALGELAAAAYEAPAESADAYDVLIKNGRIYDGTGNAWYAADVAIRGERIAAIGKLDGATAKRVIDAAGLAVSPGFIDMLGQSETALLIDNRSLSKLSQGITTEITGEGGSIAPQNEKTLAPMKKFLERFHLTVDWTTLDGYFKRLEKNGTPLNLGTYVGAAQIREAVIGDDDKAPTPEQLEQMKALVAQAMKDGALGISTALIYPPGHYAKTEELIELARVASQYGGIYATHMRSEGASQMAALDEAIRIGREANLPVEIFHLKVSGQLRWGSMPRVVAKIQAARDAGVDIRADMYPYLAGATALASSLPPWVADGGVAKLLERLKDPAVRRRIHLDMAGARPRWENLYFDSGGAGGVMIASVANPALKKYEGKTVAEMAALQKKNPLDALMDFVMEDNAQTGALYFIASESDLQYGLKQPWTSIGLDYNETSLDGAIYEPHGHPRGFGSMPRFLGHYTRDLKLLPLEQAIRKITSMPAQREHLIDRGLLKPGFFADITIFDPATIKDEATYTKPAQLSQGVQYVFVNGQLEFEKGQLTGAKAGRALRGPGWRGDGTRE